MDPGNEPSNTNTTPGTNTNTEAELESFRQKWREEVTARSKAKAPAASSSRSHPTKAHPPHARPSHALSHSQARRLSLEGGDEVNSYIYHDLDERQHGRRLDETSAQTAAALAQSKEPMSALEHYEKAVEKESQGSLGDSLALYRKAFKLDSAVQEAYKAKHFPPSYFKKLKAQQAAASASASAPPAPVTAPASKPQDPSPSNASATVPNTAHHSLRGLSTSLQTLISEYSKTTILGEPAPTDLSPAPPCPIASIPEEIMAEILEHLAVQDLASFARLSQVCRRLAYLVVTEERVWKRLAMGDEYGFGGMHFTYACGIGGKPLPDEGMVLGTANLNLSDSEDTDELTSDPAPSPAVLTQLLVPTPYPSYRTLFRQRPRIRFNGCYISTVNYARPGQAQPTTSTWSSPIHIVTYFRYLRFLRDGTCISLLTTSEPPDVVPYLYVEHLHKNHHNLPTAPMKDAVLGRWRLSGPEIPSPPGANEDAQELGEKEGTLHIETPGATPKYIYRMALSFGNAGKGARNNKLTWQGYWSYNLLTDDWAEFGLKNDRAFYFSRVKSYGLSWDEKGIQA
ncbi:hypothetical protein yc1106_00513 [Curvularia clavata]|uniref:F-box domain-containing protein n=1 Tax=Curvularia clavata TaxID=95742 RepID=A0A9Q9DP35_CURCL|nr:hypothetical protein yc1106_00513 [Curvularia clavata]